MSTTHLSARLGAFYFFYYATVGAFLPYWAPYLQSRGFSAAPNQPRTLTIRLSHEPSESWKLVDESSSNCGSKYRSKTWRSAS